MIKYNMAPTARRLVEQVMAIKPGERVLLVTDSDRSPAITEAMAHALAGAGVELAIMHMNPHLMGGIDLPPHVAGAMNASDVVVLQTSFASVHTDTHREARKHGARILDMWGWEEEMMTVGGALADYDEVARITGRVTEALSKAATGRFTTPEGCDISFSLKGRDSNSLIGVARNPGEFTACPDGESAIAPVEGTTNGVMVNPFSIERKDLGFVTEPIRIEVKDGQVVSISGSAAADRFWALLEEYGELAKNMAEFAVGTNPASRKRATMREAKKSYGTCHMAVGDSGSIGGNVVAPPHVDMIFDNPTVWADDEIILKDGKILI